MIPKDCKHPAEADFPIAEVSRHAAREKATARAHPSTLHLWWARRPLASSRAVLLALLWPDPCDPLCPTEYKSKARRLLPKMSDGMNDAHNITARGYLITARASPSVSDKPQDRVHWCRTTEAGLAASEKAEGES